MPPLVPAIVNAKVPEVVIGEPATETIPPVNVCATEVTVPEPLPVAVNVPAVRFNPDPTVTLLNPPEPLFANNCAEVPVVAGA